MPDQHRTFFAQLPFILIGALDSNRQPWATVLAGPAGFIRSPDPRTLVIDAHPIRSACLCTGARRIDRATWHRASHASSQSHERRHSGGFWVRTADRSLSELRQLSEVHPGPKARVRGSIPWRSADSTGRYARRRAAGARPPGRHVLYRVGPSELRAKFRALRGSRCVPPRRKARIHSGRCRWFATDHSRLHRKLSLQYARQPAVESEVRAAVHRFFIRRAPPCGRARSRHLGRASGQRIRGGSAPGPVRDRRLAMGRRRLAVAMGPGGTSPFLEKTGDWTADDAP